MLRTDIYGAVPGLTTAAETYENEFRWGQYGVGLIVGAYISGGTVDVGNTPTWELRAGLVLGRQFATGQWTNYSATNTDGSEVAQGVLMQPLRVQDFQGVNQPRFYGILVGGPVQAGHLFGLDGQALQQMRNFQFVDLNNNYFGMAFFDWLREISKTASYTIVSTDNGTLFDNAGASGTITLTLPPLQNLSPLGNGQKYGAKCITANSIVFSSNEGSNIVLDNNASGSTATLAARIGTGAIVFSNPGATKWIVVYYGAQGGANETIT